MTEKKSEEEKLPEKIILTKHEHMFLAQIVDKRKNAEAIIDVAGETIRDTRKMFFEHLYDFYPELKGYHFTCNIMDGVVDITGKKSENDKKARS